MNDSTIYLIGVVLVILGGITWKSLSCLTVNSGAAIRASDRERRDLHQLITQLVEKQNVPLDKQFDLTQVHAQERVNQVRADAALESQIHDQKTQLNNRIPVNRPIVNTDPGSEL